MKRRSWLWFIVSALLALMAGAVAIYVLTKSAAKPAEEKPAPSYMVVVARQPIPANSLLGPDNVQVVERTEPASGAATTTQAVIGMRTLRPLGQNDPILLQDLTAPIDFYGQITGTRNLEILLDTDKIAVALPADDVLSKWGAVLPGDHVDVLFSIDVVLETALPAYVEGSEQLPEQRERDESLDYVTMLALQNLEVLDIVEEPTAQTQTQGQQQNVQPTIPGRALILKVDPQDAVILKYFRDVVARGQDKLKANIDVSLRSPTNSTLFDVDPVNINYLITRYGITLPEPLE